MKFQRLKPTKAACYAKKCQKEKQILQIFYRCLYSRMRQEDLTTLSQMKKRIVGQRKGTL